MFPMQAGEPSVKIEGASAYSGVQWNTAAALKMLALYSEPHKS